MPSAYLEAGYRKNHQKRQLPPLFWRAIHVQSANISNFSRPRRACCAAGDFFRFDSVTDVILPYEMRAVVTLLLLLFHYPI